MGGIIKCFNNSCNAFDRKEVNNCCKPLTRIRECPDALVCYDDAIKPGRYYQRILNEPACQCGRRKSVGMPLCFTCFDELPHELKKGLYKKPGQGGIFEQAYEQALKELK